MTSKRSLENVNITPDGDSKQAASLVTPRSRKCLVLSPRRTGQTPLTDKQNLPSPQRTPVPAKQKHRHSPESSPPLSPPELGDEDLPSLIPKTPQPELRRVSLARRQISTPTIKTPSRKSFSIEKPKFQEAPKPETDRPSFEALSFYSSGSKTPQPSSKTSTSAFRSVKSRRNLGRLRARSTGGNKRKRDGLGFGGGHAIKKPKLTPKPEKSAKISELPVGVRVDLPASSSSYKSSKTPAKTSGQLSMSASTKVEFEVKAGQMVFRARAKTATTPTSGLRRSPRKHMSPLKADYFSKRGKTRERNKLFSPTADYMGPSCSEESTVLPSPVKFQTSEPGAEMSSLISSLAVDQEIEMDGPVGEVTTASNPELPDVSSAVNDILNDLSSGDDSMESLPPVPAPSDSSQSEGESGETRLFPIFYKPSSSLPASYPPAESAGPGRRFVCSSLSDNQALLDAGQKVMGPVQCQTCGAVYSVGDPQEEEAHHRIHRGRLDTLKFPGWKIERKVGDFPAGRVICIKPGDHSAHWNKVTEILSVVDTDLGFSEVGIRWPDKTKVFLYIAEKKVVGVLLAERIEKGFRMLPNNDEEGSGKIYCCSETAESVMCGISRIWVLADFRRAKVASSLLDCMRSNFYQNHFLSPDEFAFSDPTMDGIKFASNYMKTKLFLVYSR